MFVTKRKICSLVFWLFLSIVSWAETGENVYQFMSNPYSAKTAGLGGVNVSTHANDVNQFYYNPALFTAKLHNSIALSYVNYLADANGGMVSYAYTKDSLNFFGFNFIFMGYGDLEGYDKYAQKTGSFSAGDFAWNLVYARYLGAGIKVGLSLKPIYSHIENYSSAGLAFDLGANYYHEENDFSVGFVVKDFGFRFSDYYDEQETERLPWNMQIGLTKGLKHAPFAFSVTYDHLNDWSLDYSKVSRTSTILEEEEEEEDESTDEINGADMFFRHLTFGVEVKIGKSFHLDVGCNVRRLREYSLLESRGLNGFSFGTGFKVYKFKLDASYAQYAPAGGTFTLSLASNIESFKKQKE